MDHTIIKEAATKIVANIKAMEDDITVLRNKQDIISTSDTTMTGSYPGRLSIEEIGGKCEQFTTTGKSLVDFTKGKTSTNSGITYTVQPDGSFKRTGTATTDIGNVWMLGNYGLTPDESNTIIHLEAGETYYVRDCLLFTNAVSYGSGVSEQVMTVDEAKYPNGVDITGIRNALLEIDKTYNDTVYPMICKASAETEWEPYTGGKPSPNPDYPQEIKKVVVSEIKTHGKNLLAINDLTVTNKGITCEIKDGKAVLNGTATDNMFITCLIPELKKGAEYTLLTRNSSVSENVLIRLESSILVSSDNISATKLTNTNASHNFITTQANNLFTIRVAIGTVLSNFLIQPMLCEGDHTNKDVEFEPYTESTITLSQPIELYGIGDVQDTIEDGKVVRRFLSVVYSGKEEWKVSSSLAGRYYLGNMGCVHLGKLLCAHTKGVSKSVAIVNQCFLDTNRLLINTEFTTLDEWTAHLQANPMTVVYELAEPVIEELPLPDQAALNSLKTFNNLTYVEFDSEIELTFKAEYGATKLGGYTLEGILAGANGVSLGQSNTDRITALEATLVNNI